MPRHKDSLIRVPVCQ